MSARYLATINALAILAASIAGALTEQEKVDCGRELRLAKLREVVDEAAAEHGVGYEPGDTHEHRR